jgi:hypothetical protein
VALRATQIDMRTCQGEPGIGVIEGSIGPVRGRMTGLTGGRESGGDVGRIGSAGVIRLMARVAKRWSAADIAGAGVALLAIERQVGTD